MGEIKGRLRDDLAVAMRSKDELRTATIRMALTAITNAEVAGSTARQLSGDEEIGVLTKESKMRREAAQAFRDGDREAQAEREEAEARVLADYLPAPLTDDELSALVDAALAETGASTPREMGAVMKVLQPRIAGRADGSVVAAAVKSRLLPG